MLGDRVNLVSLDNLVNLGGNLGNLLLRLPMKLPMAINDSLMARFGNSMMPPSVGTSRVSILFRHLHLPLLVLHLQPSLPALQAL